jgi:hypothetical protein
MPAGAPHLHQHLVILEQARAISPIENGTTMTDRRKRTTMTDWHISAAAAGEIADKGTAPKILNYLLTQEILTRFKGNEGWVYAPNRKHTGRMRKMLYELQTSQDEIWKVVATL